MKAPRFTILAGALGALFAHAAWADDFVIQRVLVEGARASQLGIVDSASAGSIGAKELAQQIIYRPGELLEATPGFQRLEMRRGIEAPETFLLLVWWQTLEDHTKGFRESDGFVQWRAVLGPLFASPPAVEHYDAPL